jgi:dihydropteroate synthase
MTDDMTEELPTLTGIAVANGERLSWGRRTYVMGVINVTPDSFSGDGLGGDVRAAVEQALRFEGEGADFLDIGAESTRPGHQPVSESEELARLLPSLEAIAARVLIPISVDTWKSGVGRAAMEHGASIINDVWGLQADAEMPGVAAEYGAGLILMHNQRGHQYHDLIGDIVQGLSCSVDIALDAGVSRGNLVVDPGIGFGKNADQNLDLLRNLQRLRDLSLPVLVGTSRKSTIGRLLGLPPEQRLEGTAATVALAIAAGADVVRVHDVREMSRVCRVSDAVVRNWRPDGWEDLT